MTVGGQRSAASRVFLRWASVLAPLAAASWAACFTRHSSSLGIRDITLLIGCSLWLLVGLAIALSPACQHLTGYLAAIRGPRLVALVAVALLGIGAFALWPLAFNWLPVVLAFLHAALATARPRRTLVPLVTVPVLTLLMLDGVFTAVRNTHALAGSPVLQPLARYLYSLDWTTVHLLPDCGQFDPKLTYRLRPGECKFSELEFDTTYKINSLGVRDDEESLDGPEIVVLGDSFAMGWGVEQDEAFPSVLEELLSRKVLNAAISSYATAREFGMLARIDLSRARYLIIQYASNDFEENRLYATQGNHIPTRGADWYQNQVAAHTRNHSYRAGKYVYEVYRAWIGTPLAVRLHRFGWPIPRREEFPGLPSFRDRQESADRYRGARLPFRVRSRPLSDSPAKSSPLRAEADAFLNVVANSPVDLSTLQVIVLSFDFDHRRPRPFIAELTAAVEHHPQLQAWNNLHLFDIMPKLGREDYLTIDSHLTPQGHAKVAENLFRQIEESRSPGRAFQPASNPSHRTVAW